VQLPAHLNVGQGYGKVAWGVRTIWESYVGWFKLRSTTELYGVEPIDAAVELVKIAGVDAAADRARSLLDDSQPVLAVHIAEAVVRVDPKHRTAIEVLVDAHRRLLTDGGDTSFWESGWLRTEIARWEKQLAAGAD